MAFSLNTRKDKGVVIIELSGKFTVGEPVLQLRTTIDRLIKEGDLKFIVNLENASLLDSGTLGELVSILTSLRARGGDLKLITRPRD